MKFFSVTYSKQFFIYTLTFFCILSLYFCPTVVIAEERIFGTIEDPIPTKPGSGYPPGCLIVFRSPTKAGKEPNFACAIRCVSSGSNSGKIDVKEAEDSCNFYANNMDGDDEKGAWGEGYYDKDGNLVPPTNVPELDYHDKCEHFVGPMGYPNWTQHFPNGHPRCNGVRGEPHLITSDGVYYDLQAVGEFTAVRALDDNLEIQVRLEPFGYHKDLSVATAVAARASKQRVVIGAKTEADLMIDGKPVSIKEKHFVILDDGSIVMNRRGAGYSIVWQDDTNLHVEINQGTLIDISILPGLKRDGRIEGLLGNADGNKENDFKTRDGKQLAALPDFNTLYKVFAESWRIKQEESLFDYKEGENTGTFTDRNFPSKELKITDLTPAQRTRAENICFEGGVVEPKALDQCVYDVGFTGDPVFIQSALLFQTPPELRKEPEGVVIEAPSSGFAAQKISVGISGHKKGFWFGFAPAGSGKNGKAPNPYADVFLTGDEQEVKLSTPTIPGKYELRYRESSGALEIIKSKPFEIVAPEIEINAANTAKIGEKLEVQLKGDLGDMTVTIVTKETPAAKKSTIFHYLNNAKEKTLVFNKLPEEPGEYEIRCVDHWDAGQVYAKHQLTIE